TWSSTATTLQANILTALSALPTFSVTGALSGQAIIQGKVYDNTTLTGGLQGGQVEVVKDVLGNLTIPGPVKAGSGLYVGGNVGATGVTTTLTLGGAVSGQVILLGSVPANVTFGAAIQSGAVVAINGPVTGTMTVLGSIDSTSSLIAGGNLGT